MPAIKGSEKTMANHEYGGKGFLGVDCTWAMIELMKEMIHASWV